MAKNTQPGFACSDCGWQTSKWVGRCAGCGEWGSVVDGGSVLGEAGAGQVVSVCDVPTQNQAGRATGIGELDRVLGAGVVAGSVILLAGEPGVGKSTLVLEVAARWASTHGRTLYVTGEESTTQVGLRAGRTGALVPDLLLAASTDLGEILNHIAAVAPSLVVIDSIQTVQVGGSDTAPGGVSQIKEATAAIIKVAKARNLPVILVGQVTKDGAVAGPRYLEHLVDVVLTFEGERQSGIRLVRAVKNRFGAADEVGCFELTEKGIVEVTDPSRVFAGRRADSVAGTSLTVTLEGRRPLLAEVQALVAVSASSPVRRMTHGFDSARTAMLLAVVERKGGTRLANRDVYVSTVGGARITDPGADLAVAIAVASAAREAAPPGRLVAFGEVGLAGELRPVQGLQRRLTEAGRLGFAHALVPAGSQVPAGKFDGVFVRPVASVGAALAEIGLGRPMKAVHDNDLVSPPMPVTTLPVDHGGLAVLQWHRDS